MYAKVVFIGYKQAQRNQREQISAAQSEGAHVADQAGRVFHSGGFGNNRVYMSSIKLHTIVSLKRMRERNVFHSGECGKKLVLIERHDCFTQGDMQNGMSPL